MGTYPMGRIHSFSPLKFSLIFRIRLALKSSNRVKTSMQSQIIRDSGQRISIRRRGEREKRKFNVKIFLFR